MNFDFFMFLLFMSIASFAMAFLAYGFVVRFWGKTGWVAKIGQVVLVPILIILFDFVTIATPVRYRYYVGSLPLAALAALIFYFYFIKGESPFDKDEAPKAPSKPIVGEKKESKKSQRIHAARQKRGRE